MGLAASVLRKMWDSSTIIFSFTVVLCIFFQLFNLFIYVWIFGSLKKMFQLRKTKDPDQMRQVHIELVHALANPVIFQRAHNHTARTRWTQVRAAVRLGALGNKSPKRSAK